MTISTCIEQVNRLRPVAYDENTIASWLLELDGKLFIETQHSELPEPPRKFPEDGDMPLTAGEPYSNLYVLYVIAMIDFNNREIGAYNNAIELFNAALAEYKTHYIQTHLPPSRFGFSNVL